MCISYEDRLPNTIIRLFTVHEAPLPPTLQQIANAQTDPHTVVALTPVKPAVTSTKPSRTLTTRAATKPSLQKPVCVIFLV